MIKRFYQNYRFLKTSVLLLGLSLIILILYALFLIQHASENEINNLKMTLKNEAISHFESMVVLRRWNAMHSGVFIKQEKGLEPNPFLADNLMTSRSGEHYLRVNPAWMTKQVAEIANRTTRHYYHITSLTPLNPANAPADSFEKEALEYLGAHPDEPYTYTFDLTDKKKIHFMGTLRTEASCIKCHSDYEVGQIRGGIRVSLPADDIIRDIGEIMDTKQRFMTFLGMILLLVGISLVYLLSVIRSSKNKDELMAQQSRHLAMADLIVSISHHWRQPLNALALYIQDLGDANKFGELDQTYLDNIIGRSMHQINYMSSVIDDFKNLIDHETRPETVTVDAIIQSSIYFNEPALIQEKISLKASCRCPARHFTTTLEDNRICNQCDMTLNTFSGTLKQVLINLIRNSIDAVSRNQVSGKGEIRISFQITEEERLHIRVEDNGGGIPEKIKERVFDPYFTTKENRESMGMGLYVSKNLVEKKLSGSLRFENSESGAAFTVEIPRFLRD